MSKIGRPTKLNADATNQILDALRLGVPQSTAVAYAGISRSTYYRWLAAADDPEASDDFRDFRDAVEVARAEAEVRSVAVIQNASGRSWQAAAWFLERSFPEHWARKDRREITGRAGGPVELTVDTEALSLRLRELIATQTAKKCTRPAEEGNDAVR
jgi:hypothetical protein